ncbi:uncharacterized protein LOC129316614 [Prosopis cineraria]|uniref:uncharacterized protein LOC129316614 n=1 Tax=Prosopis cineraria TaxID=364024 RepID=UPI00240F29EF|nr:uncharacterized protein LOC129316614 [Prosopis cineraria]
MVRLGANNRPTLLQIFNSLLLLLKKLLAWLMPPSEGGNEYDPSWSLASSENILLLQRETTYYSSSHGHNFHSMRDSATSFNAKNFNFYREAFPSNSIFAPLIIVLLSFLQIRSSINNPTPFELDPIIFMASLVCSVAYYFTIRAKFMFRDFASWFEVLASVSGSLAVALLICLILQLPWWSVFIILLLLGGFLMFLNKIHKGNGVNDVVPSQESNNACHYTINVVSDH